MNKILEQNPKHVFLSWKITFPFRNSKIGIQEEKWKENKRVKKDAKKKIQKIWDEFTLGIAFDQPNGEIGMKIENNIFIIIDQ